MTELEGFVVGNPDFVSQYLETRDLMDAYFASLDRTGERAQQLGYTPQIFRLGRSERYEVPAPFVITIVGSSGAVALVTVVFTEVDPVSGYGDWKTAGAVAIYLADDEDEASEWMRRISIAFRAKTYIGRQMEERPDHRRSRDDGRPAF